MPTTRRFVSRRDLNTPTPPLPPSQSQQQQQQAPAARPPASSAFDSSRLPQPPSLDSIVVTPQMQFQLSQGTMDTLYAEANPITTEIMRTDFTNVDSKLLSHAHYFGRQDEGDAEAVPFQLAIESEHQIVASDGFPDGLDYLTTASQGSITGRLAAEAKTIYRHVDLNAPDGGQSSSTADLHEDQHDFCTAEQMADFPSNITDPGVYGFGIEFPKASESEAKKTLPFKYVSSKNKLFTVKGSPVPLQLSTQTPPPSGARVRATAIFTKPQHLREVVTRCANHCAEDHDKMPFHDHFVRCQNPHTSFEQLGSTARQSVCFAWPSNSSSSGQQQPTVCALYEFLCLSTCKSINRRDTQLVLSLEHEDKVLGRQVFDLKVCACPGRDAAAAEKDDNRRSSGATAKVRDIQPPMAVMQKTSSFTTVQSLEHPDEEIFTVKVRGRELYRLVQTIVQNYELANRYRQMRHGGGGGQELMPPAATAAAALAAAPSNNAEQTMHTLSGSQQQQLTPSTPVASWLRAINAHKYVYLFRQFDTLHALAKRINLQFLQNLGVTDPKDRQRIYASYVAYSAAQEEPSSSMAAGNGPILKSDVSPPSVQHFSSSQSSTGSMNGYRISKHTVKHLYRIQPSSQQQQQQQHTVSPKKRRI